ALHARLPGDDINGMSPIGVWAAVGCGASDGRKMAGHRGPEVTMTIYASFRFGPGSAGKAASQLSLRQGVLRRGRAAPVLSVTGWASGKKRQPKGRAGRAEDRHRRGRGSGRGGGAGAAGRGGGRRGPRAPG